MKRRPRVPNARILALAVEADVDPRTIRGVLADPTTAETNKSRARAARTLRSAGLLPDAASADAGRAGDR